MKIVHKLIESFEEELEGAKEYAEKYIDSKARGNIVRAVSKEQLREQLVRLQDRTEKENKMFALKKGRRGNERQVEK